MEYYYYYNGSAYKILSNDFTQTHTHPVGSVRNVERGSEYEILWIFMKYEKME